MREANSKPHGWGQPTRGAANQPVGWPINLCGGQPTHRVSTCLHLVYLNEIKCMIHMKGTFLVDQTDLIPAIYNAATVTHTNLFIVTSPPFTDVKMDDQCNMAMIPNKKDTIKSGKFSGCQSLTDKRRTCVCCTQLFQCCNGYKAIILKLPSRNCLGLKLHVIGQPYSSSPHCSSNYSCVKKMF